MANSSGNKTHVRRIMNDLCEFYEDPPAGIFIVPEENNICLLHALVIGPAETPYPDDYPLSPPKVQLRTTYGKTVRFGPNLYPCGKVCLSILGTWTGPSWSSSQTIFSMLLSIQSLMDSQPYHNEPGYEKENCKKDALGDVARDVSDYNDLITHETLRIAVIEMLQENNLDTYGMPVALKEIMVSHFKTNYEFYENLIRSKQRYDGKATRDPYRGVRPDIFMYKKMLDKIASLRDKLSKTEDSTVRIYKEIATKTLSASYRHVLKPTSESSEDVDDLADDSLEEADDDGCLLYESMSDDDDRR